MHINDQTNSVPDEQFGDQYLNSENTGNDKVNDRKTIKSSEDSADKTHLNIEDPEKLPNIDNSINDGENDSNMYSDGGKVDKDKEELKEEEAKVEELKEEEAKVEEVKEGEVKEGEGKEEEAKEEEVKEGEGKEEEGKDGEGKEEEVKEEEVKEEEVKVEEVREEEANEGEANEGETKEEEVNEGETKEEEVNEGETKEEEVKEEKTGDQKGADNDMAEVKMEVGDVEEQNNRGIEGKDEKPEKDEVKDKRTKTKIKVKEDRNKEINAAETEEGIEVGDVEEQNNRGIEGKDEKKDERLITGEKSDPINYSLLSKADLIKILEELISDRPVQEIRFEVEAIKTNFYKKHKSDLEEKRKNFTEDGSKPEDFKPLDDPDELHFRELLKKYRDQRIANTRFIEEEKQENLKQKYQIIEEIKDLINSQESINKTFQDFRELQNRWRDIGVVPQLSLNDLWETYHHYVESFYDYININKELRDLDLRKNLEEKLLLCEKAEALLLEPNILNAFNSLQVFHEEWREIGPVPIDKRAEIWERFKEATSKINKKHQLYYQDIKEQQRKNLEQKTALCERVESLLKQTCESHKDWVNITSEILEIQKTWKTIGFAPKKENNKIYSRFRSACDRFFESKREFYVQNMREQNNNLQKKLDLCLQAETLKDSEDWRATTEELIKLQKKWKLIGPVPRRQSELIWKRFRGACDKFFSRKLTHYKQVDSSYETNLELKENLIKEISEYKLSDDMKKNLDTLQAFQRRWTEIGFVPLDKKDEIQQRYRDALNIHFDNLQVDDIKKNVLKFGSKVESIMQKPRSGQKLRFEREKYMNKLLQLKSDISVWENNIGFFANNENSEGLRRDFEKKIEDTHNKIKLLEEKINLIDDLDLDDD